jgi:Tetracyclin repressor-like, C-terminal domain
VLTVVVDGVASGEISLTEPMSVPRTVHADFANLRTLAAPEVPDAVLSRALLAWSQLFGSISLEMFGHLHNVIHDYDAYFEVQMRHAAEFLVAGTPGTGDR